MNLPDQPDYLQIALEEYFSLLEQDQKPEPAAFLAKHPECREELSRFLKDAGVIDLEFARIKHTAISRGLERHYNNSEGELNSENNFPKFKRFQLLEQVGFGSQGVVYKAIQIGTGRTVALKIIREGIFASPEEQFRFEREVRIISSFQHPNIVNVFECGQDCGRDYFAMEWIDGKTLDSYLEERTLDLRSTVELFLQICKAMDYAHQRGAIHRDLKPANILVDANGTVHILDFGLARVISESGHETITRDGEFAGTLFYAAPEQVRGESTLVGTRCDVYAVGLMLFEGVTDCFPYPLPANQRHEVVRNICEATPLTPSALNSAVDSDLDAIILCSLQKDPSRRYESMAAMAGDLQSYLEDKPIWAKRDSRTYIAAKFISRFRWHVAGATALLVGLIGTTVALWIMYKQAEAARSTVIARTQIVRNSQHYTLEKLDEFNRLYNQVHEATNSSLPTSPARTHGPAPARLFRLFMTLKPEPVLNDLMKNDSTARERAKHWLIENESILESIAQSAANFRFEQKVTPNDSGLTVGEIPALAEAELHAVHALIARGTLFQQAEQHHAAIENFQAARDLAVSLGDGRLLHQKVFSVMAREKLYDVLLDIINTSDNLEAIKMLAEYLGEDPPIVDYRPAFVAERHRLSQLVEDATFANGPEHVGVIDIDKLHSFLGYQASQPVGEVDSKPALALIDEYIREVENWDDYSEAQLNKRQSEIIKRMEAEQIWHALRPLFSGYKDGYLKRRTVCKKRQLLIISAGLIEHRVESGHWPDELSDDAFGVDAKLTPSARIEKLAIAYTWDPSLPVLLDNDWNQLRSGGGQGAHVEFMFAPCLP